MHVFKFNRRGAASRIVAVQLIPAMVLYYGISIKTGAFHVKSLTLFLIIVSGFVMMYAFVMSVLIKALRSPVFLAITEDRVLLWRPLLKDLRFTIPEGSLMRVTAREVAIHPPLTGVPTTSMRNGSTVFRLPRGLMPYRCGNFTL